MTVLFNWNETFLTGLPSVDHEHQRLVDLINDVGELVMSGDRIDPQAFAAAHDALLHYARHHFGEEDAMMQRVGLDRRHIDHHRSEHRAFATEVVTLGGSDQAITPERASNLVEYLVHWLAYHILGVDQSMARQMRAIEGGQAANLAFENDLRHTESSREPLLAALSGLFQIVSDRNRQLRILNRELEQRVAERTAELETANRQLHLLSIHDDLTGLPNRRFAVSALDELWAEARRDGTPLSVLMIDADHFKPVNDTFGHATGDALLRELAIRLHHAVRTSDIVCRLGGDEFLVICPRSPLDGAAQVAQKILVGRVPFLDANGTQCWDGSVSIGIAEAGAGMVAPEDLLRAADEALYSSKHQGCAQLSGG